MSYVESFFDFLQINEEIVQRNGKWFVYSKKKSASGHKKKLGGPYTSKTAAEKRLRQVEFFKHKK